MCQFFSGIITREKTLWDYYNDSHEELIRKYKLNDNTHDPDFVRVELLPQDNDIFNHDIKNWKLKVDQDYRPEWFNEKFAEQEMKKAIKKVFKKTFLMDQKIDELINQHIRFAKNVIINRMQSSRVGVMGGSSRVGVMGGSSRVGVMGESSQVGVMGESSQVGVMRGGSQVGEMWGSSQVGEMRESSQVGVMGGSSQVKKYNKTVKVNNQYDKSLVIEYSGDSVIIITPNKDTKLKKLK